MAAPRSRLGRDPLSGAPKPATKKNGTAKSKAAPKTARKTNPVQPATAVSPATTNVTAVEAALADTSLEGGIVAPRPLSENALFPGASRMVVADTGPTDLEIQPVPQSAPVIDSTARQISDTPEPSASPRDAAFIPETTSQVPQAASRSEVFVEFQEPASVDALSPRAQEDGQQPAPSREVPVPATCDTAPATPPTPAAAAPCDNPDAASAATTPTGHAATPATGPHPAEVFLRGVLEGLTPAGGLVLDVDVDPDTFNLPVEKLFYFSHVLQLLVSPLETPTEVWRKPGDRLGPVAGVSIRLRTIGRNRHSLRIYDNGLFFGQYLPDVSLHMEALRPLMLFVAKRDGSISLKQGGRCVEFEIIG